MNLPYISSICGIGGNIKNIPADFCVSEIPLITPTGNGQHLYLDCSRQNLGTQDLVKKLQQLLNISSRDIGFAGLKDKCSLARQSFSLSLGNNFSEQKLSELLTHDFPELTIHSIKRHQQKLRTGHLIGNHFKIKVSGPSAEAYQKAQEIAQELNKTGIPNFFGPQRFSKDNDQKGKEILLQQRKFPHWQQKLFLSAYQAKLFNQWLTHRIAEQKFHQLIPGDMLQNLRGGRPFPFAPDKNHSQEFKQQLISYTGPIFGSKMPMPSLSALTNEQKILEQEDISQEHFQRAKLDGTRRIAWLPLPSLQITPEETHLWFEFSLPKGCYATVIMREFLKTEQL